MCFLYNYCYILPMEDTATTIGDLICMSYFKTIRLVFPSWNIAKVRLLFKELCSEPLKVSLLKVTLENDESGFIEQSTVC
jgi:hypothetical protein